MQKTAETDAFWREFTEHSEVETDYVLVSFGDTPEMAEELLALVLAGTKRATASLARDYGDDREPLPRSATTSSWSMAPERHAASGAPRISR